MKILTANRLTDGEAVWYGKGAWLETIDGADLAEDKAAEERLDAIGAAALANNVAIDINLIDVKLTDGSIEPLRLREKIRAAGPTNHLDHGKQAENGAADAA